MAPRSTNSINSIFSPSPAFTLNLNPAPSTAKTTTESVDALAGSLSVFYEQPDFSDVQIECDGHKFAVHKIILAHHSPVFKKMMLESCKDTNDGVIRIHDSSVAAVDAMVFFMYHFRYNAGKHVDARPKNSMLFHARVYALAQTYDISDLKEHAKARFGQDVEARWDDAGLPDAIKEVYSTTPDQDRGLRDAIVAVCRKNSQVLACKQQFRDTLRDIPVFAYDLVLKLASSPQGTTPPTIFGTTSRTFG